MSKKKILFAAYSLDVGGIEISLVNLLKNINYKKYSVTLALEKKIGIFLDELPKEINVIEYKVSQNKVLIIRKFINFYKQLRWKFQYKNYYDCSISYATYSKPCSFLARASSKNSILFVHSNYCQLYNDDILVKKFFNGIMINKFKSIIFVSNEAKKDLCDVYEIANKSFVINNLVDYDRIIKLSKIDVNLDLRYAKNFVFVGRLDESSKKVSRIIEVAKKCKDKKMDVGFWIVGDGPDLELYRNMKDKYKLGNVIFYGKQKNPYPYIKNADYLILTSSYEGFPVVYNEAIILGKPILTTIDVSDDFISIPNRFGIIAKHNVDDIFDKVIYLLNNGFVIKEKVNFKSINNSRIKNIEEIMEYKND